MKKTVLFGAGKIADVIYYLMAEESDREIAGFTVDGDYVESDTFHDLPVVPFADVQKRFPPEDFDMFVALGYQNMNSLRQERISDAEKKGYSITTFVHPNSTMPAATDLGKNCFIMNDVLIHPWVKLGDNVFVWSGALIGHHSTIGDNCWITSNANIAGVVTAGRNCFFSINATIANNVTLGDRCFLGANCLVTKDLADGAVVIEKSSELLRLNSDQFFKMSRFT